MVWWLVWGRVERRGWKMENGRGDAWLVGRYAEVDGVECVGSVGLA